MFTLQPLHDSLRLIFEEWLGSLKTRTGASGLLFAIKRTKKNSKVKSVPRILLEKNITNEKKKG